MDFLRQFRLGGYAIFDLAVSYLGIFILAPFLSKLFLKFGIIIPKKNWFYLTLPIGILTHLMTGNFTKMTREFIDPDGHYLLKVIIVVMTILGVWSIKRRE